MTLEEKIKEIIRQEWDSFMPTKAIEKMTKRIAEVGRFPNLMICPWCMGYFDSPEIHDPDACGIRQDKAQLADELVALITESLQLRCDYCGKWTQGMRDQADVLFARYDDATKQ